MEFIILVRADHLKVDVFRVTVGGFGFRAGNVAIRAASRSGGGTG